MIGPDAIAALRSAFAGRLLTDDASMAPFLSDWRRKWQGRALAVAQPDATADVAAILRWCHAHRVPVVPQGGNTGLSGGSVPDASGSSLLLSLQRMNKVREIDAANATLTAEAGCVLAQVQSAAAEVDLLFPLSLATEGSCTLGGNLATNAGGVQVLRYGNTRELCLGLEVVLPDGQVWDGLRGLRKDNTGYDLKQCFIGSEGTLGVITAAVMKLFPRPAARAVAWSAVSDLDAALQLLALAQRHAGAGLTAFELISDECVDLVLAHVPTSRTPLAERSGWSVLIELSDPEDEARVRDTLESLLGEGIERGWVTDAAVSATLSQSASLWALRENISEAQAAAGPCIKHDIALPLSAIPGFVPRVTGALCDRFPAARPVVFGHLGDGNLHFNVSPREGVAPADFVSLEGSINRLVHDAVHACHGSISAEHGLGVLRRDEAARYKSPVEQTLMRALKSAIDPLGLMNPGKVL